MSSPLPRAIAAMLVQWTVVAFGIYVAFSEEAFPGASTVARIGIVVTSMVLALLIGEVARMRAHMSAILAALKGAVAGSVPRDDRAAVDVLVRALTADDPDVRVKAHKNLVRLTGQTFTMDPAAWQAWWKDARADFVAKDVARPG